MDVAGRLCLRVCVPPLRIVVQICRAVHNTRRRTKLRVMVALFVLAYLVVQFLELSSLFSVKYGPSIVQWLGKRGAKPASNADASRAVVLFEAADGSSPSRLHSLDLATSPAFCENTRQGWDIVTDDRGRLCSRMQVQMPGDPLPGCCPEPHVSGLPRYSCEGCDSVYSCCPKFEICVACCLHPRQRPLLQAMLQRGTHPSYFSASTPFALCRFKCRTSSASTVHENTYRSSLHHCFGLMNPPLRQGEDIAVAPQLENAGGGGGQLRGQDGVLVGGGGAEPMVPQAAISRDPYLQDIGAPFWPGWREEAAPGGVGADTDTPTGDGPTGGGGVRLHSVGD